jgi:hypothetical protein
LNHKLAIVAFVIALTAGALIYQPISGSSSASDTNEAMPAVYLAEIEGSACVSDSPVHTSLSETTAEATSEIGDGMPTLYLVMLEEGVCASMSPISTSDLQGDDEPEAESQIPGDPTKIENGVWYIQK